MPCRILEAMSETSAYLDRLVAGTSCPLKHPFMAAIAGAASGNLEPVEQAFKVGTTWLNRPPFTRRDTMMTSTVQTFQMEIAAAAARSGSTGLPILQWLAASHSHSKNAWSAQVCGAAALSGSLQNLLFLRRLGNPCPWHLEHCAQDISSSTAWHAVQKDLESAGKYAHESAGLWALAAQLNDAAVMTQLRAAGQLYPCDPEACHVLLRSGQIELLEWLLHDHGTCIDLAAADVFTQCVRAAISSDGTAWLSWLRSISPAQFWQQPGLYSQAQSMGRKQLLRSHEYSCPCTAQDWAEAAQTFESEALDELELLMATSMRHDQPWDRSVCEAAAYAGRLGTVQWLWDRVPAAFWDRACAKAYEGSSPNTIQWLLQRTPPCPFEPYLAAHDWEKSRRGFGDIWGRGWTILGYHYQLPSKGLLLQIPLALRACYEAAASNNIQLMRWLRARGCPWDARTCSMAASRGHIDMLRWLRSQSPPCPWESFTSQTAAQSDDVATLTWLLSQQPACPFPYAPDRASDRCLQLLIAWGCPMCTTPARLRAADLWPLPASLVLGLTRWYGKLEGQGSADFRLFTQPPEDDLLALMSGLPQHLVQHICHLAGLCGPNKISCRQESSSNDSSSSGS